ncbi:hypothetical protein RLO149_c008200 [Roseobacter litoralis Och 149]|uniref:Uncharacterized protein n=1 Tax=Roseobacter litoralis (strain ATCC 49566 / DSM 6996 / JCM 21268 / NBRC 15278 / OCh 149) TaxID=391595 RepID=F7ZLI7_ROSLO|nr:hypothetical protein RLO149_c008200 [Roseobacter litoralis Och 149]
MTGLELRHWLQCVSTAPGKQAVRALCVQLFNRTNRGIVPTVFGKRLTCHGKPIFAQTSNAAHNRMV